MCVRQLVFICGVFLKNRRKSMGTNMSLNLKLRNNYRVFNQQLFFIRRHKCRVSYTPMPVAPFVLVHKGITCLAANLLLSFHLQALFVFSPTHLMGSLNMIMNSSLGLISPNGHWNFQDTEFCFYSFLEVYLNVL